MFNKKLKEKILESVSSVIPVTLIVVILCITIAPISLTLMMMFLTGAVFLVFGMGFFTLGADLAMIPIGEAIGKHLTKLKNVGMIAIVCFFIGFLITLAEPDLQVLANQVPSIPNLILIVNVAVGVGIFLVLAFLKTLLGLDLSKILVFCYVGVFFIAFLVPDEFLAIAFDSGGVTTGPITVPFIMALGLGLASIGKSKNSESDNFGLIALCSIGPILAVMILGLVFSSSSASYTEIVIPELLSTKDLWLQFERTFPIYIHEVSIVLLPIFFLYLLLQIFVFKMPRKNVIKIMVGLFYTMIGLVLFLSGVNVGFMPVGNYLGQQLASYQYPWIIIPIGMLLGYYIVKAEPAVLVLNKQVEEVTNGMISQKAMMNGLSIGMAISVGLSMFRILTGISILWFLIPGYMIALGLSFVVPKIFTSIAFDSGGVASGPMTATFLSPFAMGACKVLGGNILTDAFGCVAMVAMTPLIIIQIIGLLFRLKSRRAYQKVKLLDSSMAVDVIEFDEEVYDE